MKINSRVWGLFLLATGLLTILLPGPTLAQREKIDLSLRLVSGEYYNRVKANTDNTFFLEVRNTGNGSLTNIRLSSEKPEGWVVEFKPGNIAYLGPGSLQTVDINIKPDAGAGKGDYGITLFAEANEIRKVESIWVRIETAGSVWLWIGVAIAASVVAGFLYIFVRFGRQ